MGYFFADDLEAVLGVSMTGFTNELDANNDSKTSTFTLNIGVNKYFMKSDDFGFWAGLGLNSGKTTFEQKVAGTQMPDVETKNMNVGVVAGLTYFPVPTIGLSASVGVLGMNVATNSNDDKTTTIGLNFANGVNNGLNFGFHWYFGNE